MPNAKAMKTTATIEKRCCLDNLKRSAISYAPYIALEPLREDNSCRPEFHVRQEACRP